MRSLLSTSSHDQQCESKPKPFDPESNALYIAARTLASIHTILDPVAIPITIDVATSEVLISSKSWISPPKKKIK